MYSASKVPSGVINAKVNIKPKMAALLRRAWIKKVVRIMAMGKMVDGDPKSQVVVVAYRQTF